ncbi:hypothetical protein ACP4OV_010739 [Aristida adscensionis]
MPTTSKLAVLAALLVVLLLHAPSRAVARRRHDDRELPAKSRGVMPAVMTVYESLGGDVPAECDGQFHSDREMVVALSTVWYDHGRRCHKMIRITSGRAVEARVVDECNARFGCKSNVVDESKAVWEALGLDTDAEAVPVTWSDA